MSMTAHAKQRAQQRGVPALIEEWLDEFGEQAYDGHGGVKRYFSKRSVRRLEKTFGRAPIHRMSEFLDAYKAEDSRSGHVITVGPRTRRIWRK